MNIYLNDGSEIPDETCFIIAKDGIYLKKKLELIESITPVDKISFLEEIQTNAKLNVPKIPARMFSSILEFFKEVYNLYKSEAIVLLFFNKNKKTYKIHVPNQIVSGSSLDYKADTTIKDHILIGTIHSHGSMSAFHSSTDVRDETNFDGIHITIGKVNNDELVDICSSISINGMRVEVYPENYIDGLKLVEYTPFFPQMFKPSYELINNEKVYSKTVKTSYGYTLTNSNLQKLKFDKTWLKQVTEKSYTNSLGYVTLYPDLKIASRENIISQSIEASRYKTDFSGICSNCVNRHTKIKMEEFKETEDKDCIDNFELDFSDFDSFCW